MTKKFFFLSGEAVQLQQRIVLEELQDTFCMCSPCYVSRAENKEEIITHKHNPGLARRWRAEIHAHLNESLLEIGTFESKASLSQKINHLT